MLTREQVKEKREAAGLTIPEAAKIAGISVNAWRAFEGGWYDSTPFTVGCITEACKRIKPGDPILSPDEVKAMRIEKGWPVGSISRFAGINRQTWRRYENSGDKTTSNMAKKISDTVREAQNIPEWKNDVEKELKSVYSKMLENVNEFCGKRPKDCLLTDKMRVYRRLSSYTGVEWYVLTSIVEGTCSSYRPRDHYISTYEAIEKGLKDLKKDIKIP